MYEYGYFMKAVAGNLFREWMENPPIYKSSLKSSFGEQQAWKDNGRKGQKVSLQMGLWRNSFLKMHCWTMKNTCFPLQWKETEKALVMSQGKAKPGMLMLESVSGSSCFSMQKLKDWFRYCPKLAKVQKIFKLGRYSKVLWNKSSETSIHRIGQEPNVTHRYTPGEKWNKIKEAHICLGD